MHRAAILIAALGLAVSGSASAANCGTLAPTRLDAYVQVHYDAQGIASSRSEARSTHEVWSTVIARTIGALASNGQPAERAERVPAARSPSRHPSGYLAD